MPFGIDEINQQHGVIDYGQYRRPSTTTTKKTVTTREYDSDGKLVKETIEETTTTSEQPVVTWNTYGNSTNSNNWEVKYAVDSTSQSEVIAEGVRDALKLVDSRSNRR